jgi:hypothetical protein
MYAALEADADLLRESWFSIDFVMRNDDNWQKVHDGWMSWKRKKVKHVPGTQDNTAQVNKAKTEGAENMRRVEEQMRTKGHRTT